MKVGLYFGTFNPVHVGHLVIANHLVQFTDLDQVWMVVTPQSPLKKKKSMLDDFHRIHMVHLATKNYDRIQPSDIEFHLSQPNYTIDTMAHLHEKFPKYEFSLIMGQDNLDSFHKWKNYDVLLERYNIYVYPRIYTSKKTNAELNLDSHPRVYWVKDAPIMEISSTFIRKSIKSGKDIRPLLDAEVWQYIDHNLFYKK